MYDYIYIYYMYYDNWRILSRQVMEAIYLCALTYAMYLRIGIVLFILPAG